MPLLDAYDSLDPCFHCGESRWLHDGESVACKRFTEASTTCVDNVKPLTLDGLRAAMLKIRRSGN